MTRLKPVALRVALACVLPAAAGACDAQGDAAVPADASHTAEARVVDALPLRRGYYVSTDTPCREASNATLHLLHEDGEGYGGFTTPPYYCAFGRIERTGPSSYRVEETCGDAHGDDGEPVATVSTYEIVSETRYRATREDGWQSSARRCPRRQLPSPWRDAGIGGYVD